MRIADVKPVVQALAILRPNAPSLSLLQVSVVVLIGAADPQIWMHATFTIAPV